MNHEARIRRLEEAFMQVNVRLVTVNETDPDRERKMSQAEHDAKAAGEVLVVWDIVDGSTRAMTASA